MKKILFTFIPFLFLAGCNSIDNLADSILYAADGVNKQYPVPEAAPEGFTQQSFAFNGEDGQPVEVKAWVLAQSNSGAPTVVYCHGNGENLQSMYASNLIKVVASLGVNVVAVDFPGYGRSTGAKNEYNFVTGVVKATEWAHRHFPRGKLYMWGRSMGASVATLAANKTQSLLSGLVLTSPWDNFIDTAKDKSGLAKQISKAWLAKNGFDSGANAPSIKLPVLIHHGVKDKTIPIKFGRQLFSKFTSAKPVNMREFPDREHNDIFLEKQLWQDVYDFVQ